MSLFLLWYTQGLWGKIGDDEVLEAFRQRAEQQGTGYQTMMNQALREYLALSPPPLDEATLRRVLREELHEVRSGDNAPATSRG